MGATLAFRGRERRRPPKGIWTSMDMALALKSRTVSFAFGVGSFFLADGNTTVRVDVSSDLLARLAGSEPPSKAGRMELLVRHRALLAQIAAAKYDEGEYRPEVNVRVVRIDPSDVL
jgi:Protein of unknown function (DUF1488)